MSDAAGLKVTGLTDLVREMKGPAFRDVNQALRPMARGIADEVRPHVELLVRLSKAPQAQAMASTVRTKSDRVPVIVIGMTNPRFSGHKFAHKGESATDRKRRRGAMAHGIVYGPKGGHRPTSAHSRGKHRPGSPDENFYGIPRDDSGGAIIRSVTSGSVFEKGCEAYLAAFLEILTHYGFVKDAGGVHWGGGR